MSLRSKLPSNNHKPKCPIALLAISKPEIYDEFVELADDVTIGHSQLYRALVANGVHNIAEQAIGRHRRHTCACTKGAT